MSTIEKTHAALLEKGPRRGISPYFVPMIIVNMAPGLVSIRFGCKGPNFSHVSACSTGAHSIGEAMRAIQRGDADAMFAGGCEATITPLGVGGFNAMRALVDAQRGAGAGLAAVRLGRDGFVIAEGAGVLIVEELETAKKRGAHIYCELRRLRRLVGRALDGAAARRWRGRAALHEAWRSRDAKIDPERVGYINAHGTSTKQGDIAETVAVKTVFGDHAKKLAMSSTKSMTGHTLGAAGGIEAAFAVLAIERGMSAADDQPGEPRSRVRSRLRAEHGARGQDRRGAVEQLRLRRHQRDADLRRLQGRLGRAAHDAGRRRLRSRRLTRSRST